MKLFMCLFVQILLLGSSTSQAAGTPESKRVVALSPVLTEILFALGAGHKVVGTTTNSDHPAAAKAIPRVGDYSRPIIEKILLAKPNLLLIQNEGVDNISPQLRKLSVPITVLNLRRLSDYPSVVSEIGKLVHKNSEAQRLIADWTTAWATISAPQQSFRRFRFLIQLDRAPLIIAGGNTFVSEAFEACGGTNVAKGLLDYPAVQREWLTKAAPDVTILLTHGAAGSEPLPARSSAKKNLTISPNVNGLSRLGPELPRHVLSVCAEIQSALQSHQNEGLAR